MENSPINNVETLPEWKDENLDKKLYVFNQLKETNPDYFKDSTHEELKETIDALIEKEATEINHLVASGVPEYEAIVEAAKLVKIDTPYSLLTEYITEKYLVDIESDEYIDKALCIAEDYKEKLLNREFNDSTFNLELEMAFK